MGTQWRVRAVRPEGVEEAAIRAAAEARLDAIIAQMSQWEPASLLSRFNHADAGSWTILTPDFAAVIDTGLEIARLTDGAFDPAIGRLVDLWGFGPVAIAADPDDSAIGQALAVSGWRRLAWDRERRYLRQPGGLALDLAGIAKGYAVDVVADRLGELGVRDCLVEIGGELVGRGVRPDGQPWWVDLEVPAAVALPGIRVALHGLAVATSGEYRRGAHTLDPRTGRATRNSVVSVSVIHRTALEADGWATAITVLGRDKGIALAASQGIAARMIVVNNDEPLEYLTPALEAMIAD